MTIEIRELVIQAAVENIEPAETGHNVWNGYQQKLSDQMYNERLVEDIVRRVIRKIKDNMEMQL